MVGLWVELWMELKVSLMSKILWKVLWKTSSKVSFNWFLSSHMLFQILSKLFRAPSVGVLSGQKVRSNSTHGCP